MRIAGGAPGPLDDAEVPERGIVVTTPGAEPAPGSRYAAALLLDADAMLGRAAFDADVEAVRRWRNAIALVRSADEREIGRASCRERVKIAAGGGSVRSKESNSAGR